MITKMPWPRRGRDENEYVYSQRQEDALIMSSEDLRGGQTYMNAVFERSVAPLLTLRTGSFTTVPLDGDPENVSLDNILLSGVGFRKDVNEKSAKDGELLRVKYDINNSSFTYIYRKRGEDVELEFPNYLALRHKASELQSHGSLRNKRYLLVPEDYVRLVDDYEAGNLSVEPRPADILRYRTKEIRD